MPQSRGNGYGFFIAGPEGTNYGKQVWLVSGGQRIKIFEVNNGYIVANSRYNTVNYATGAIALHIRYAEPHSPDFEFYYDGIVIIDGIGRVVGSFMFRDLAKFMCDYIMGHIKYWKYFKMYFGVMSHAILTKKRYIMVFPDTSPRGLQLVTISAPGAPPVYDIHPEYKPQNKIPAGIYAYNFSVDQGYVNEEIYRDFSVEKAFFMEQTQTYMPLPVSPYVDAYAYIFGERFDQIFVFEPIMVLPMAVLDATAFDLEKKVIDASEALRGDKSLIGAFGFHSRGFFNQWFITPDYVGAQSVLFIGWDSGITGFKIDAKRLDYVLDQARPELQWSQDPEIKSVMMFIEYAQLRDKFVLGDLGGAVEVFWHLGPPMWMYTVYDMYIGLVAYVSVEYEDTIYFLNDKPVYVGDLEFKILNYTTKILRRGPKMYIYGFDSTEGVYKIRKGTWGLEELKTFDWGKYISGPEILLTSEGTDLYLLQAISVDKETFPMNVYVNALVKESVKPSKLIGGPMLVILKEDGGIGKLPKFLIVPYYWNKNDNKIMTDGSLSAQVRKIAGIDVPYYRPGFVDEIVGAYSGFFVKQNDGELTYNTFVNLNGGTVDLEGLYTTENFYARKVVIPEGSTEVPTFDKFLANDLKYDIITLATVGENQKASLKVLRFLEGEVI